MWELDPEEGWVSKNWCFQIAVLKKTLQSPLNSKEIKPVNDKGNQPWIHIGRTDAKAEVSILWPPDLKSWLTGKDPDAGKDEKQEEKGTTEDEMVHGIIVSMNMSLSKFLETVKDREAWNTAVHSVPKSGTWLSNWTTTHFSRRHPSGGNGLYSIRVRACLPMQESRLDPWIGEIPLEKAMAIHSSILAWEIPQTEESGGLRTMGPQKSQTGLRD